MSDDNKQTTRVTITVTKELRAFLEADAKHNNRSLSNDIVSAVTRYAKARGFCEGVSAKVQFWAQRVKRNRKMALLCTV